MNWKNLFVLSVSVAVLALTSSSDIPLKDADDDVIEKNVSTDVDIILDGINLADLTPDEVEDLLDVEDDKDSADIDLIAIKNYVEQKHDGAGSRKKRWIPIAIRLGAIAARHLFRTSIRSSRFTTSGSRITRTYARPGSFNNAVRDFNRFGIKNAKPINTPKVQGFSGQVGNHKITVRSWSRDGRPTLDILSPKSNGGSYLRKFRYGQK